MPRIARVIIPNLPHHVTQRGNRRQITFFREDDYSRYLQLLADRCSRHGVEIWAYCLMPNHVHLMAVPKEKDSLRRALGETHREYTRYVNQREGWSGCLWQGRFSSCPMDERHSLAAARYIELNPVEANLVKSAEEYPWSSATPHLEGRDDVLVRVNPLLRLVHDWKGFLTNTVPKNNPPDVFEVHAQTGRPLGSEEFVTAIERELHRDFRPRKPGPKQLPDEFEVCPRI